MRLTRLCALTFALSLCVCGGAAAQVGALVKHNTANDPCKKFKMRVLMPADANSKPPLESPAGAPDPGIVWNPCRVDVIQVADVPVNLTPGEGTSPAAPSFTQPSALPGIEQPTILAVKLPPAFVMMRRRY